jgi:WD repeat-containing protein 55
MIPLSVYVPPREWEHVYSGDGTLSVMDIRSKKPEPFAHSEDQEDELLSIVPFKG